MHRDEVDALCGPGELQVKLPEEMDPDQLDDMEGL